MARGVILFCYVLELEFELVLDYCYKVILLFYDYVKLSGIYIDIYGVFILFFIELLLCLCIS